MIFTLQAISTFMGLPPNSVGGEQGPGDLRAAACEDLAVVAAASQRWRNRVTSSWSSTVLMCLMGEEEEEEGGGGGGVRLASCPGAGRACTAANTGLRTLRVDYLPFDIAQLG